MKIAERNNKLKHFITCLKCEVSGKCCNDNCSTQYDAGNMGEIIENLEAISKVLEQEPFVNKSCVSSEVCEHDKQMVLGKIRAEIEEYRDLMRWDSESLLKWEAINYILDIIDKYKAEIVRPKCAFYMPPQHSSELEKNSKKLEKDFGELDCISREQVLEQVDKWRDDEFIRVTNPLYYLRKRLNDLPSVTPQEPRWIPCSEKKPDKGGEYLLWGKIDESEEEDYCFIGDYHEFDEVFGTEISNYDPKTLGFIDTEIEEYYSVVAWMPLPLPWKGE